LEGWRWKKKLKKIYPASKPTVARDLALLLKKRLIKTSGKGKNTVYSAYVNNPLLREFNIDQYFFNLIRIKEAMLKKPLTLIFIAT